MPREFPKSSVICLAALSLLVLLVGCEPEAPVAVDPVTEPVTQTSPEYIGIVEPASIIPDNAAELAQGAVDVSVRAILSDATLEASAALTREPGALSEAEAAELLNKALNLISIHQGRLEDVVPERTLRPLSSQDDGSFACPDSGTMHWENTDGQWQTYELEYRDCTLTEENTTTAINGLARYEFPETGAVYTYDLNYERNGELGTMAGSFACVVQGGCTFAETYEIDGTVFDAVNVNVLNFVDTFNVSMQLFHESYGYVFVQSSGLTLCPAAEGMQSGELIVRDQTDEEILVTFDGCGENSMAMLYRGERQWFDQ